MSVEGLVKFSYSPREDAGYDSPPAEPELVTRYVGRANPCAGAYITPHTSGAMKHGKPEWVTRKRCSAQAEGNTALCSTCYEMESRFHAARREKLKLVQQPTNRRAGLE